MQFKIVSLFAIVALIPTALAVAVPEPDIASSPYAACNGWNHYNVHHCCAYYQNGKGGKVISGGCINESGIGLVCHSNALGGCHT